MIPSLVLTDLQHDSHTRDHFIIHLIIPWTPNFPVTSLVALYHLNHIKWLRIYWISAESDWDFSTVNIERLLRDAQLIKPFNMRSHLSIRTLHCASRYTLWLRHTVRLLTPNSNHCSNHNTLWSWLCCTHLNCRLRVRIWGACMIIEVLS